jgi:hypothetical protein
MVFMVLLSACVSTPVKDGDAEVAVKLRLHAVGEGLPASKDASIDKKKQEAFMAAFSLAVRQLAEEIENAEGQKIMPARIGEFVVFSDTIVGDGKLITDIITMDFKGKRFIIKDAALLHLPVEFADFPKWNDLPSAISGIEIKEAKWDDKEGTFIVRLAYLYESVKTLSPSERFDGVIIDASGMDFTASTLFAESDGYACMREDKSQTVQAAMADAKRKAIEKVLSYIKSETKGFDLEKDMVSAYSNATVNIIKEFEKAWYKDAQFGDCYKVKIKAEVIPDEKAMEKIAKSKLLTRKILALSGETIYDPEKMASKEMLGEYTNSLEKAKTALGARGVKNPLVITKGITSDGRDIFISNADALKILRADKATGFLKEAKVGFIIK